MKTAQASRRAWIMGGGAGVLLLVMLVAPRFAPKPSPSQLPDEPSIATTDRATDTTSGAEGLTGRPSTATIDTGEGDAPSLFSFGILIRVALVGIVLAAAVMGLRWWNRRAAGPRSTTGFIRVIDTLPINGGRAIHLVEVGNRVLAVGATAQQLSLITELTDDEAGRLRDRIEAPAEPQLGAFAQQLMQHLRRDDVTSSRPIVIGEDA